MRKMLRNIAIAPKVPTAVPLESAALVEPVPVVPIEVSQVHTCWEYMDEYDGDGPSPAEYCSKCQHEMREYNIQTQKEMEESQRNYDPSKYATDGYSTWEEIQEQKSAEQALYANYDIEAIIALDTRRGTVQPWWYYQELYEESSKTAEERAEERRKAFEDFKDFKKKQEEFGYWYQPEHLKEAYEKSKKDLEEYRASHITASTKIISGVDGNGRDYINSIDKRSPKLREKEFQEWLAIPKNVRPIYLEGGKLGRAMARGNTYSVLIKDCFAHIRLCDIRLFFARFGGIRDVYRPIDRVRGIAKPITFLEMVKYEDAAALVKYFENRECLIDDNVLLIEMADNGRKSSSEMSVAEPSTGPLAPVKINTYTPRRSTPAPTPTPAPKKNLGAFGAFADSDSE